MSIIKDIEFEIKQIHDFVNNDYAYGFGKLVFSKGNQKNGVTHKIFQVKRNTGSPFDNAEIFSAKTSKEILFFLKGYYVSLTDNINTFAQR